MNDSATRRALEKWKTATLPPDKQPVAHSLREADHGCSKQSSLSPFICPELNDASSTQISYGYTYEDDGRIDTIDSSEDGVYDYDYDETGQLTDVTLDSTAVEDYDYDANGNRSSATAGSSSSVYATTAYNRLESVDDGTNVTVYGYDFEGNLVLTYIDGNENGQIDSYDSNFIVYTWDYRNRLTNVDTYVTHIDYLLSICTEAVEYKYDYLNRLVSRTTGLDGVGAGQPVTEYFVYDGGEPGRGLSQFSSSENGTVPLGANPDADPGQIVLRLNESGAPTYRYLWSDAVDHLLADEYVDDGSAGDIYWPLADHQNTVRDLVQYDTRDNQAEVVNHITYDSYGNVLSETRATDHIFGYTGRLFDKATGLQNNLNRWYDPEVGRWLSEDPIGFEGGDANLYRYVANDPGNGVDPGGLQSVPVYEWINGQLYRNGIPMPNNEGFSGEVVPLPPVNTPGWPQFGYGARLADQSGRLVDDSWGRNVISDILDSLPEDQRKSLEDKIIAFTRSKMPKDSIVKPRLNRADTLEKETRKDFPTTGEQSWPDEIKLKFHFLGRKAAIEGGSKDGISGGGFRLEGNIGPSRKPGDRIKPFSVKNLFAEPDKPDE